MKAQLVGVFGRLHDLVVGLGNVLTISFSFREEEEDGTVRQKIEELEAKLAAVTGELRDAVSSLCLFGLCVFVSKFCRRGWVCQRLPIPFCASPSKSQEFCLTISI